MTIALVQQLPYDHFDTIENIGAQTQLVLELDNVAEGLKYFGQQLRKTSALQARFALLVQLKTWTLNKPTLQTLLAQYMDEIERTQSVLHVDPASHVESVFSLCEQLMFLSAVFDQESKLIEQLAWVNTNLMLCD